jgi:hypothetical protein
VQLINPYHDKSRDGEGAFERPYPPTYIDLTGLSAGCPAVTREDGMNHSIYSADRATHLKIVVIGLLCAILVAAVGIFAHVSSTIDLGTAALVKAGRPTTLSGSIPAIR